MNSKFFATGNNLISALCFIVFWICFLCSALITPPPRVAFFIFCLTWALLALLIIYKTISFFLNRKKPRADIIMLLFGIVTVCAPLFVSGHSERKWFFEKGMHIYENIVIKAINNKDFLTDKNSSLEKLVGMPNVWGKTNGDGSVVIRIDGRAGSSRHGYLYYSGNQMILNPNNTNFYCFPGNTVYYYHHLTNGWYEY